jgi:hypothetical protein
MAIVVNAIRFLATYGEKQEILNLLMRNLRIISGRGSVIYPDYKADI